VAPRTVVFFNDTIEEFQHVNEILDPVKDAVKSALRLFEDSF
jgi:hypothetical protein